MISLSGLVVLCAAMASSRGILVKKDHLKMMMDCGTMSRFKTTIMENPGNIPNRCVYSFARHTPDVTQLRIELEEFHLMQPQEVLTQPDQRTCVNRLSVNGMSICGNNNGQHVYVPFDKSQVSLVFEIPVSDSESRWRLNVTQLESKDSARNNNKQQLPLATGLQNLKKAFALPNNDASALAPPGCTQYFIDRSGTVESFNYNGGNGPYMSNQSYTICFKRYPDSTAVELTFSDFGLPNEGTQLGMDLDCHSAIPTEGRQEDYLAIPGASTKVNGAIVHPTYFCGTTTNGKTVTFGGLGPFVMYFYSDLLVSNDDKGFKFNYNIV